MIPGSVKLLAAAGLCAALALLMVGNAKPIAGQLASALGSQPAHSTAQTVPPRPPLATTPAARTALTQAAALRLVVKYRRDLPAAASAKA